MAGREGMHGRRDGKHWLLLETGVQHFGRKLEYRFGESGTGKGPAKEENGSEGQPVAGRFVAARLGGGQLYSVARHSGVAGSDAAAADAVRRRNGGTEPCAEDFGRCECEDWRRPIGCVWGLRPSNAGGVIGEQAEC